MTPLDFNFDDGGRKAAGFKGTTGDCVIRSIAIAAGIPYKEVYDAITERTKLYGATKNNKVAKAIQKRGSSPRNGVYKEVYQPYLEELGWKWIPCMSVGSGCKVHLSKEDLPKNTLIVSVSRHLVCVRNHTVIDTYDCTRDGNRCVYGYYTKVL